VPFVIELPLIVQKNRDRSTDSSLPESRHDTVMAERLREANLVCELTDCKQRLLKTEQQVS